MRTSKLSTVIRCNRITAFAKIKHTYSVSQSPPGFFWIFSQRLRIFKQSYIHLLDVHIYIKLQNVIQLSLNLTKVCHIMILSATTQWIFTFHYTDFIANVEWPPNSPDLNPLDYRVGCSGSGISQTSIKAQDHSGAKKCTAADLGWFAAEIKLLTTFADVLKACASATGGHFEHTIWALYRNILTKICCFRRNLTNCVF